MLINLSQVLTEPHKTIEENVTPVISNIEVSGQKCSVTEICPVKLCIEYMGDKKLRITGRTSITVMIPCDRCLTDVSVKIPLVVDKSVITEESGGKEEDDTDEANYIDGYYLDVEKLLYSEILLGWPMKVLCSKDCKGICSVCGRNLNEGSCGCEDTSLDPRMSVIRDIFKNFKEV